MEAHSRTPLSDEAVHAALGSLSGWAFEDNTLTRTFEFGSFREAISFIVRLSFEAEDLDHHPELSNVYNRVAIALCTHDAGNRVTQLDVELAQRITQLSWV